MRSLMTLMTLGDSHSLFSFAGVSGAKIYWRGPVTMHRAARDGIASLVPRNCRPNAGDVLILSFGEIDSRTHIPRLARANGRPTSEEADLLLGRFEQALRHFRARCPATVALSCIGPYNPAFLEPQWYGSDEECRVDAKAIRDRMNARLATMGVPFIDFRAGYTLPDGSIDAAYSDDNVHIDARHSEPVLAALRATLSGDFRFREPPWPPHPLAEGPYQSPWKRFRRAVRGRFKALVCKAPAD